MTTELTLREKVLDALSVIPGTGDLKAIDAICNALDATGAPAYIRVADDLRGVWVDEDDAPAWPAEAFETAQISRDGEVLREATGDFRGVVGEESDHEKLEFWPANNDLALQYAALTEDEREELRQNMIAKGYRE